MYHVYVCMEFLYKNKKILHLLHCEKNYVHIRTDICICVWCYTKYVYLSVCVCPCVQWVFMKLQKKCMQNVAVCNVVKRKIINKWSTRQRKSGRYIHAYVCVWQFFIFCFHGVFVSLGRLQNGLRNHERRPSLRRLSYGVNWLWRAMEVGSKYQRTELFGIKRDYELNKI